MQLIHEDLEFLFRLSGTAPQTPETLQAMEIMRQYITLDLMQSMPSETQSFIAGTCRYAVQSQAEQMQYCGLSSDDERFNHIAKCCITQKFSHIPVLFIINAEQQIAFDLISLLKRYAQMQDYNLRHNLLIEPDPVFRVEVRNESFMVDFSKIFEDREAELKMQFARTQHSAPLLGRVEGLEEVATLNTSAAKVAAITYRYVSYCDTHKISGSKTTKALEHEKVCEFTRLAHEFTEGAAALEQAINQVPRTPVTTRAIDESIIVVAKAKQSAVAARKDAEVCAMRILI